MTKSRRPAGLGDRLVRRRLPVAAEVAASQAGRRAWVCVTPVGDAQYRASYLEVESGRYAEVLATWDYDKSGLLLNHQETTVSDVALLPVVLGHWLADLSKLSDPGTTSYPI